MRMLIGRRVGCASGWKRRLCMLALAGFLVLVVAHGVNDAFHDAEAGAAVCIALAPGFSAVRPAPPAAIKPSVLLLRVVVPTEQARRTADAFDSRGSPQALSPLRL